MKRVLPLQVPYRHESPQNQTWPAAAVCNRHILLPIFPSEYRAEVYSSSFKLFCFSFFVVVRRWMEELWSIPTPGRTRPSIQRIYMYILSYQTKLLLSSSPPRLLGGLIDSHLLEVALVRVWVRGRHRARNEYQVEPPTLTPT